MTIRMIGRHIREGLKNMWRNGWMSFASVSAVAITLLILGAAMVVALNAEQLSTYVTGELEINVYLNQQVTDAQGQQVAREIDQLSGVKSVQYISKEEGFKRLKKMVGTQYASFMESVNSGNTLPVQLVVKAANPRETTKVAAEILSVPSVHNIQDGENVLGKLFSFLNAVRDVGLAFVIALIITAMFLISNTIRLAIFSRRREIEIMKLVGATNWFIRWPFVWEGILIGVLGAAIPFAIIAYGYQFLYHYSGGAFVALSFPLMKAGLVAHKIGGILFGIGIIIGLWGGIMSVRRFLRI